MDSARPSRRRIPKWLPQLLGYSISALCLIWVLHGYPLSDLKEAIQDLDWKWLGLAIGSDLAVYVIHGWRWNTLLTPVARLGFWRTVQAIYIGLFANEVLPLRVGELIRVYLLTHWNGLRLSLGFASAAVERVIDGFWLLIAFVITASLVHGIPENVTLLVQVLGVLLIAGTVAMWVIVRKRDPHAVEQESRYSETVRHIIEGLQLMGNRSTLFRTVAISALYLAVQMFSYYALIRAYRTDFSFWVGAGLLTMIRFATVIPNAPGNLGVFQLAAVKALTRMFEMNVTDAKTLSLILWAALTLPLLIGGALATALTGVSIGELRERARRSADAAP